MVKELFKKFNLVEILRKGWSEEHKLFARSYARKAKRRIDKTLSGLGKEASETNEMAKSFFKLLEHKLKLGERSDPPTKEEVKAALEQLKDIGKISVFITAVVLPGGVFSLLGMEMLARRFNIDFSMIPSAFKKQKNSSELIQQENSGKKRSDQLP